MAEGEDVPWLLAIGADRVDVATVLRPLTAAEARHLAIDLLQAADKAEVWVPPEGVPPPPS